MKAIVAVDANWGIGCGGRLLQHIPEDMKFFKQTTLHKVVIMGRETFESLPGQEPLKDRVNIVLSRKADFIHEKVTICRSLPELFRAIAQYDTDDVFVIGGESVYTQLLPYCSAALVTKIEKLYVADKFFVDLDEEKNWRLVAAGEPKSYQDIRFSFCTYVQSETAAGV